MRLNEYLSMNRPGEFRAAPLYFDVGDYLTYFVADVPHVAERLDDVVTVYLSCESRELVGIKVKGVSHILKDAKALLLGLVDGEGVPLGVFLFAGRCSASDEVRTKWYRRLEKFASVKVENLEAIA